MGGRGGAGGWKGGKVGSVSKRATANFNSFYQKALAVHDNFAKDLKNWKDKSDREKAWNFAEKEFKFSFKDLVKSKNEWTYYNRLLIAEAKRLKSTHSASGDKVGEAKIRSQEMLVNHLRRVLKSEKVGIPYVAKPFPTRPVTSKKSTKSISTPVAPAIPVKQSTPIQPLKSGKAFVKKRIGKK